MRVKILKKLRNDLVRLRNLITEQTGNLRNSPVLEKKHRFLYFDTECMLLSLNTSQLNSTQQWTEILSFKNCYLLTVLQEFEEHHL